MGTPWGSCRIVLLRAASLSAYQTDLNSIASLVATLVVPGGRLPLRSSREPGTYAFIFQRFSEPIVVISSISKWPFCLWLTTHQSAGTKVAADVPFGHEQVQSTSLTITDGVQFCIHAAIVSPPSKPLQSNALQGTGSGVHAPIF